jgi:S-DNA-T family DNA segregation ATPase FtsK/SpoIIIE
MQVNLTVTTPDGAARDVAIAAADTLGVAELSEALDQLLSQSAAGGDRPADALSRATQAAGIYHNGQPLTPSAQLGDPELRHGSQLSLGPTGGRPDVRSSVLELRVISGPDSGRIFPLVRGTHVLGRSPDCDVVVADEDMSRRHAQIEVSHRGVTLRDLGSTNGTSVDDIRIGSDPIVLASSALALLGRSTVTVGTVGEPPAATSPAPDGTVRVNRPPRFTHQLSLEPIDFPSQTDTRARPGTQWLATLLPAVLGVGLAVAMHNPQFLAFALLSPITLLASAISDRRSWGRSRRISRAEHAAAQLHADTELASRLAHETAQRRRSHPDAAAIARTAAIPDCRLWERRPGDPDFLSVRLACATQPAHVRIRSDSQDLAKPSVAFVPVVLSLAAGALGIAGPTPYGRGLARWVLAQLLVLHSPNDVRILALLDDCGPGWRWLRWSNNCTVALTEAERGDLLDSAVALVTSRLHGAPTGAMPWVGPWTVLLIDPASSVASLPGLNTLLQDGPRVGVTAVCVSDDARLLPLGCRAVAQVHSAGGDSVDLTTAGEAAVLNASSERVSLDWCEQLGRRLAPLRDAGTGGGSELASEVRLLDLLDLDEVDPHRLMNRWRSRTGPVTAIGTGHRGRVVLDLVRDGPHGLIAGSTGSGKSELLRSIVAGLASTNSPADLAFILIDYKGGAAFAECGDLPHTIAVITDLDPHLTRRALISLDAELRRRETAFAQVGVGDIDSYYRHPDSARDPLPRLVLIVDEFASLAEELPDFISGLVAIAQRGRSLGLHLLLATQRPNGVVSPEIKANMSLRIALRVTDPAESADVISSPAAATINKDRPGRVFAQLAQGLVEFQTARVGLPVKAPAEVGITLLDDWNRRLPQDCAEANGKLDLHLLVDAAREAALQDGLSAPAAVWLAPLPSVLSASDCRGVPHERLRVNFGLLDEPALQRQSPLSLDLGAGGSIAFIGGPRSGRTTALRSIAGIAAHQIAGRDLQLYVLDCAGGSLRGLTQLPSCATALTADEPGPIARLLQRLSQELDRRLGVLAASGLSSAAEGRARGLVMPAILLVLDGWERFSELSDHIDGGRSTDVLLRILRDSPAAAMTVVIAGDRALLGVRVSSSIGRKVLLSMTERSDYSAAGISLRAVPAQLPPGRAVLAPEGAEVQVAVLDCVPTGDAARGDTAFADMAAASAQWAAVALIAAGQTAMNEAGDNDTDPAQGDSMPIRIRPLPSSVRLRELQTDQASRAGFVLGCGGDGAEPISVDLLDPETRFLIAGPSGSGRSTAARVIAAQALAAGTSLLIAATSRSPLAKWARDQRVTVLTPQDEPGSHDVACQLLIVDDAEAFNDTVAGAALLDWMANSPVSTVACVRPEDLLVSFRGIGVTVKRSRTGLLLQPGPGDGELLGLRIPAQRPSLIAGRGVLMAAEFRGTTPGGLPIQVALDD